MTDLDQGQYRVAILRNVMRDYYEVRRVSGETAKFLTCVTGSGKFRRRDKRDFVGYTDLSYEAARQAVLNSNTRCNRAIQQAQEQHADRINKLVANILEETTT